MRALILAALLAVACLGATEPGRAAVRHHHHHVRHSHARRWREARVPHNRAGAGSASLVNVAMRYVGDHKFTRMSGPWCRDAVNVWLRQAGLHTDRSRLAMEALRLGPHLRAPRPGALGVMRRRGGGHVVVVVGRRGNEVEAISPNWSNMVKVVTYPLRRFVAFVQPVRGR